MFEMEDNRLRDLSRALLQANALSWVGPAARVAPAGPNGYRVRQGRAGDVVAEGEARGVGGPPPGDGLAVLYVGGGKVRWFRLDRKLAVRLAGYN